MAKPTCAMGRGILGRYICVRIVQALPLMLGVVVITFFIPDPAAFGARRASSER